MAMATATATMVCPSSEDLVHEEMVMRNPKTVKPWWRYLIWKSDSAFKERFVIYERALKALPGSYKLWYAYLRERLDVVRDLCVTHPQYESLNNTFERALMTMHRMPKIWLMYLQTLTEQKLITKTRRTFDRALVSLPVTQHGRIWESYLEFASQEGIPVETALRVHRRYLRYDPSHIEDFIEFLLKSGRWQESAESLASALNGEFHSSKGKSKHSLWMDLLDVVVHHADEVSGLDVDAIIRGGIRKFREEVGMLWTSLADYYIRKGLFEKAREIYEEGMMKAVTGRDFSVVFDVYSRFEESCIAKRMELDEEEEEEDDSEAEDELEDVRVNTSLSLKEMQRKILGGHWLNNDNDVDLRLARLEELMNRRPVLVNSVMLRQNPHNVEQWHRRVKLFEGDAEKQIHTYTEAVKTVDPMKATGKSSHTLWVGFAKIYESHGDLSNARLVFDKAVQENYKNVDHLARVWCEWVEMELRHNNFEGALELMRRATAAPSLEVRRRVATACDKEAEPVQLRLHKSLKLWSLYVDLEESLGTLESTREAYDRMLDLKIATPQIILSYAQLLEENSYFEDAFKVYERGVKIFKHPHVKDIWVTYLSKFVKRYGNTKMERTRELFENAVVSSSDPQLYLEYAKFEEEYGLAKRAMEVYREAAKNVADEKKLEIYEIYIARAAERFGFAGSREVYKEAIEPSSGLPENDVKTMCIRLAEMERSIGEVDRARAVYRYASEFADPEVFEKWHEFEVEHGNEDTYRDMLGVKRTVTCCSLSPPDKRSRSLSDFVLSPLVKKSRIV